MNIEETDYVEIVERCNLKTGVNTVFSGGEVLRSEDLSPDEIYEKYKDYLTKDQIRDLYKNSGFNIELDLSVLDDLHLAEVLKVFSQSPALIYESDNSVNYPNYVCGIDPINSHSTGSDFDIDNQPRF